MNKIIIIIVIIYQFKQVGVPGQSDTEMCFGNILYYVNAPAIPGTNPFTKMTTCPTTINNIPATSTFPANTILSNHAKYGNQTGTVIVSSNTVNLVILLYTIVDYYLNYYVVIISF